MNNDLLFQGFPSKGVIIAFNSLIQFFKSGYWIVPLSWGFIIVLISPRFGAEYSADSFAYMILGNNIFSGFGFVSQAIRDFYATNSASFFNSSRSFPPLWPLVVGGLDKLTAKGITASLIANIFVLLLLFHVYFVLCKKLLPRAYWVAFALLLYFLINNDSPDSFVAEIVSGRSIPLVLLFFLCVCLLLSNDELSRSKQVFLGVCLGGLYLVRFDSLIFSILVILYVSIIKPFWLRTVLLSFICLLLPWLLRNIVVFGQPLASDNFLTAFTTYTNIAQLAWFDGNVPIWSKEPNLWAVQRAGNVLTNTKIVVALLAPFGGLLAVIISLYSFLDYRLPRAVKTISILAWLWLIGNILSVSITPYHDNRYFSISVFAISLSALLTLVSKLTPITFNNGNRDINDISPTCRSYGLNLVFVVLIATPVIYFFVRSPLKIGDRKASAYTCQYDGFKDFVSTGELVSHYRAEHLAYYSNWRTIYLPLNLPEVDKRFISWVNGFNVDYAITSDSSKILEHPKVVVKARSCGFVFADLKGLRDE